MKWWSQGEKEPSGYNPQKQLQDLLTIKLKRRSWFGRLLQLPKVFRNHYGILRKTGGRLESVVKAWRLARFLIVPYIHLRFTESKDVFKNINGEDILGVDRELDRSRSPFVKLDSVQTTIDVNRKPRPDNVIIQVDDEIL